MAAAIVELDALADAVRAAAENDRSSRGRDGFASQTAPARPKPAFVGRIHVGGGRGELGGAGVDALDRPGCTSSAPAARRATSPRSSPAELGQPRVGEAHRLQLREARGASAAAHARATRLSISTISWICARNHGSILQEAWICSWSKPSRSACADLQHAGRASGVPSAARDDVLVVALAEALEARCRRGRSGRSPVERSAFCRISAKVRPMAMASPTDFIEVVSVGSRRGISRRRSAGSW